MNTHLQTLRLYWQQAKHYKTSLLTAFFTIPISTITGNLILPWTISQTIGALSSSNYDGAMQFLYYTIAVAVIGALANLIGFRALILHESKVITKLRNATYKNLIAKDIGFFVNQKVGGMTSKYIDFVRNHVGLQDLIILGTVGIFVSIVGGVITLSLQSLWLGGMLVAFITLLVLQVRWSIRHRKQYRLKRRDTRTAIHGHVADTITNFMVVKMFASERRETAQLQALGKKFNHAYLKDLGFIATEGSARVALMLTIQTTVLWLGIGMIQDGSIDIATLIFAMSFLQMLGNNIFRLAEVLNSYEQMLTDAEPMTKMLLTQNLITDAPQAKALPHTDTSITFDAVSYHYGDSDKKKPALADISLTIPEGQKVGLVGHSGAGKSTLSHLLLRFADVTEGTIQVGSHDIRTVTQSSLREAISFVPQDNSLFHRSLRENIAYGKPDATDQAITKAAKQAHAWEFIKTLPDGLDTKVGERGVKLSGGQRQRIAIARALLKNAPILVLDEATSALDSESEQLIQKSFDTLMKGRTSIVIAHRLSTLQKMDRIIVMDKGRVIEDGTHDQLLKAGGTYATLWTHQSGGFLSE